MSLQSVPGHAGFDSGEAGQAYNEAGFRHFLAIEQRRSERSATSVMLALVSLRDTPGRADKLPGQLAAQLFEGLGSCVREVDFVGWYREGKVASAAMVQHGLPPAEVRLRMHKRVTRAIHKRLDASDAARLRVRIVHLTGRSRG